MRALSPPGCPRVPARQSSSEAAPPAGWQATTSSSCMSETGGQHPVLPTRSRWSARTQMREVRICNPVTPRPLIIAHRGASGYRPEHTLAAYRLAAEQGADFIEPDLVPTRDGVLVARHEPEIGGTTDVAAHPEFGARRTSKVIDSMELTGWFTEDFTLAELKTLRARERIPDLRPANTAYDGRFEIATFEEVLVLRARLSDELGRPIGVYPETKHP